MLCALHKLCVLSLHNDDYAHKHHFYETEAKIKEFFYILPHYLLICIVKPEF